MAKSKRLKKTKPGPHPMQPVYIDGSGVARFKKNGIVDYIIESGKVNLNDLRAMPFDNEDWVQFAQLMGYSVCGFSDLSYVPQAAVKVADAEVQRLRDAQNH